MGMDERMNEQLEQREKDSHLLNHVQDCVSEAYFKCIESELKESEYPSNYRIIDSPVGEEQNDDENHYSVWVDQQCGETRDNYSGTICMKLSNDKYLIWDYWM